MSVASRNHRHIAGLDGLRGVAALVVVFGHLFGDVTNFQLPQHYLAVDFFFLLSGYVIARSYELALCERTLTVRDFVLRRIIRLQPLVILATVIATASEIEQRLLGKPTFVTGSVVKAFIAAALCLPLPTANRFNVLFPLDGVQWSLFVEYLLSLIFVIVIPGMRTRYLAGFIAASAVIVAAITIQRGNLGVGPLMGEVWFGVLRGLFPFLLGVLIWRLEIQGVLPSFRCSWVVQAILLIATLLAPIEFPATLFTLGAVFFLFPLLIIIGRQDSEGPRLRPLLLLLGTLSYPIYICHVPLLHPISHIVWRHQDALRAPLMTMQIVVAVVGSYLALRLFDEPVRRWLSKRLVAPQHNPAPSASISNKPAERIGRR